MSNFLLKHFFLLELLLFGERKKAVCLLSQRLTDSSEIQNLPDNAPLFLSCLLSEVVIVHLKKGSHIEQLRYAYFQLFSAFLSVLRDFAFFFKRTNGKDPTFLFTFHIYMENNQYFTRFFSLSSLLIKLKS